MAKGGFLKTLATIGFFSFFAFALLSPVVRLLGVSGLQAFSFSELFDQSVIAVVRATFIQAITSTAVSVAIGLCVGAFWARAMRDGNRMALRLRGALVVAFSLPTIVVAQGALFAGQWVGLKYGFGLVVLAHALINAPWVAFQFSEISLSLPAEWFDAGKTLGASRWQLFRDITLKHALSEVARVAALVFTWCASSFALVLILGGGPPNQTLETEVFARLHYSGLDVAQARVYALWLFAFLAVPHALVFALRGCRSSMALKAAKNFRAEAGESGFVHLSKRVRRFQSAAIASAIIICLGPLASFFEVSTFRALASDAVWGDLAILFSRTFRLGLFSMALALAVGAAGVYLVAEASTLRKFSIESVFALASSLSVMFIGAGLCLTYIDHLDTVGGSLIAAAVLQAVVFSPFVYRSLVELHSRSPVAELEAARTLGASPFQAFRAVEWPRYRGRFLQAGLGVFFFSLADVSAVSLFSGPNTETLSRRMMQLTSLYRFTEAKAIGLILLLMAMGVSLSVFRHGETRDA